MVGGVEDGGQQPREAPLVEGVVAVDLLPGLAAGGEGRRLHQALARGPVQQVAADRVDEVLEAARIAKQNGSTRFCMGAAWRDMRGRKTSLKNVRAMVEGIRALDMEA